LGLTAGLVVDAGVVGLGGFGVTAGLLVGVGVLAVPSIFAPASAG
jgi:hypothetical protein